MVYLEHSQLSLTMKNVLRKRKVAEDSIEHVVNCLVQTSLRGTDSHGINLFPHYCQVVDSGRINISPNMKINKTAPATAILDADHAFGHHAGAEAIDYSVNMAKESGAGMVGVKNSSHLGAAAYFALRAAHKGCIGFAFTNADALVKAHASKEAFFGTNPICFCAPMAEEEPFCLDMATSLVAWNRIKEARRLDKTIPEGLAFDAEGETVTDPNAARSLAPAGGYKGFDLGMMVDILCALLVDGPISKDLLAMYAPPLSTKRYISHFFMSIDIEKFTGVDQFKKRLQAMADTIRALVPYNNNIPIMVAGDPEKKTMKQRMETGIPMDTEKFEEFLSISTTFRQAIINLANIPNDQKNN